MSRAAVDTGKQCGNTPLKPQSIYRRESTIIITMRLRGQIVFVTTLFHRFFQSKSKANRFLPFQMAL